MVHPVAIKSFNSLGVEHPGLVERVENQFKQGVFFIYDGKM
jgi:hypothetical protein